MSRRRAATKVASYSEIDTSFTDFVKSARSIQQREASKYICKAQEIQEQDNLENFNSPGLAMKTKKCEVKKPKPTIIADNEQDSAEQEHVKKKVAKKRKPAEKTTDQDAQGARKKQKNSQRTNTESSEVLENPTADSSIASSFPIPSQIHAQTSKLTHQKTNVSSQPPKSKPQSTKAYNVTSKNAKLSMPKSRLSVVGSNTVLADDDRARRVENQEVTVEMYREWLQNQTEAESQCHRLREKTREMQKKYESVISKLEADFEAAQVGSVKNSTVQSKVDELAAANNLLRDEITALKQKQKAADEHSATDKAHARDEKRIHKKLEETTKELQKADKLCEDLRGEVRELKGELEAVQKQCTDVTKAHEKSEKLAKEVKIENERYIKALETASRMTGLTLKRATQQGETYTGIYVPKAKAAVEFSLHMVDDEWQYVPLSDKAALRVVPEFLREEIVFAPNMLRQFFRQMSSSGDQ